MRWTTPSKAPPAAATSRTEPPPRWLTFRCAKCQGRFYSGYTATSMARVLGEPGGVPDLFHADCGVETGWREAELEHADDGTPWVAPGEGSGKP